MPLRSVEELVNVEDPAWPEIEKEIRNAKHDVRVLPITPEKGREAIHRLQVTARSYMGALALNCGGLLVDHGWLRIFGGGTDELLPEYLARFSMEDNAPTCVFVAFDVYGGVFAVDGGGALGGNPDEVCYLAPDTYKWEALGMRHSEFVSWALAGDVQGFYSNWRWEGWEKDVEEVGLNQAYTVYPPLSTMEGQDPDHVSRQPVPLPELMRFYYGFTLES